MNLDDRITQTLAFRLDHLPAPVGDLDRTIQSGRRLRRRRTAGVVSLAVATVLGGGALAGVMLDDAPGTGRGDTVAPGSYAPVGPLDFGKGVRAYAEPDERITIGGRTFPIDDMDYLDTSALASPAGVLFYDRGQQVHLLGHDGRVEAIGPRPKSPNDEVRPTSKADAYSSLVAWNEPGAGLVRVRMFDLDLRKTVAEREIPCDGEACSRVRVMGLDHEVAAVETPDGLYAWAPGADDDWVRFAGPESGVADLRNSVLLYADSQPPPAGATRGPAADWTWAAAAVDARLTFDGRHVLSWSTKLEPVRKGDQPLRLEAGAPDARSFFSFDSDGSVLVATSTSASTPTSPVTSYDVVDCEVPSGACEKIGEIAPAHGDPMFLGNDM